MRKRLYDLTQLGITPDLNPAECRAIGLVNRIALLGISVFLFLSMIPTMIFSGIAEVGFDVFNMSCFVACLLFNYYRRHQLAKHFLMAFGLTVVPLVNIAFGPASLSQLNYAPTLLLPLLIFHNRRTHYIYYGLTLATYLLTLVYQAYYEPLGIDLAADLAIARIANVLINLFLITYLMVLFYRGLQEEYARELEAKNQLLDQQKSEIVAQHRKLQAAQEQLIQSEKMASLGQLTAGIAHEINNPLNFISGSIGPLKADLAELHESEGNDDELMDEIHQLLGSIETGASRTQQIVSGLRTFSRLDEEVWKPVDIHEALDSTLALLGHKLKRGIVVHKAYGDLPLIDCLPGKLNQVFMNILVNAIDAIPDTGTIKISTQITGTTAQISIQDSGKGMETDIQDRVFDPFFTTKAVGSGTGLGLSIAYGIMQQHKGEIKIDSVPGQGSTFHVCFPIG